MNPLEYLLSMLNTSGNPKRTYDYQNDLWMYPGGRSEGPSSWNLQAADANRAIWDMMSALGIQGSKGSAMREYLAGKRK